MSKKNKDKKGFLTEFKEFITRGNVIDMAVGVIIGGAFSAIVNAVVNKVFMPLIAMFTGGGLQGFVTVLNEAQALAPDGTDPSKVVTYWDKEYLIDKVNVINWGDVINAIINFLIIAIILFVIVKAVAYAHAKKEELDALRLEAYYQKHPEERPVPPEPGVPEPTTNELLTQIRDLLKAKEAPKGKKAKKEAEEVKEEEKAE